ncbi:hypothetical protein D9M71_692580 [compost metagenome]
MPSAAWVRRSMRMIGEPSSTSRAWVRSLSASTASMARSAWPRAMPQSFSRSRKMSRVTRSAFSSFSPTALGNQVSSSDTGSRLISRTRRISVTRLPSSTCSRAATNALAGTWRKLRRRLITS